MRALDRLHDEFRKQLKFLHQKRWQILWRAVESLIFGQRLWLTALGRALRSEAHPKHSIKAVDRLLGNESLHCDRFRIAHSLVFSIVPKAVDLVVLIDTFEIRHKVIMVTASIAYEGRSFPIWSTTTGTLKLSASQCRRFLSELARVFPEQCKPILVTDAGFESKWFEEVQKRGWHYVGRVRGQTKVLYKNKWVGCQDLHRMAGRRAKNLGELPFPKNHPQRRRVVLSKLPKSGHRRIKTRRGPGNDTNYKAYRTNAHEPLILATNLSCGPSTIVANYKLRFQIEESFRDMKCHRWGWSLRHCLTRSRNRLEILLLIAAMALMVQQLVGIAAYTLDLARRHQSNTVRTRRVLSICKLGGLVLTGRDSNLVTAAALRSAAATLRQGLARLAGLRT
jgi:hypothetical protein